MEVVEETSVRVMVTESSEQFGSAKRAYEFFRDGSADLCDLALLESEDAFRFKVRSVDLGSGVLIDGSMRPMTTRRSAQMIARGGIDHYQISLSLVSRAGITSGRRTAVFESGDVYIVDLSQPNVFQNCVDPDGPDSHIVTLVLPRGLLAPLFATPDAVQGNVVSHKTAFGRLIADHMLALCRHASDLGDDESRAAVAAMAHLAAGAFGPSVDASPGVAASTQVAIIEAIKRHVDRNLGSEALEIGGLCRTFRLSRTALYRLFEPEGGVTQYIQQRRLHRALSMLMSPRCSDWHIVDFAVAARFSSDATFIRAFRKLFGVTPGEVRTLAERARAGSRSIRGTSAASFDSARWARETFLT
jgi:AraC-like DNA-binding protein